MLKKSKQTTRNISKSYLDNQNAPQRTFRIRTDRMVLTLGTYRRLYRFANKILTVS